LDSEGYECVKEGTDEHYVCKPPVVKGANYYCAKTDASSWTPPCQDYRVFGDHKSGLNCWDPPENYCKDGCSLMQAWYCKPDASKCCYAHCLCFRCGWIKMLDCVVSGSDEKLDPGVCDNIRASLPEEVRGCMTTNPGPSCASILDDPECKIDTTQVFCP